MLNPSQLGALLNFNRHIREGSIGCNVPPICSFLHTQTCQSLARGLRLTGPGERGRQVPAIAIIKAGLWRAPLESYGVLWDFMGGIYHINFPVKDPSGLSGSCTQLSWHGGGVKSGITVVHCSRQCTQNFTNHGTRPTLRANASACKDVPMGSDSSPETHPMVPDLLVPRNQVSWSSYLRRL